ncbi:hypothetical protein [Naasia aerilata]|nr:hypothetical protein [Naasia aerilata]
MFVLTADQVDSRHDTDRVAGALAWLLDAYGDELVLPPTATPVMSCRP